MRPGPPEERKDKRIDVALPVFLENATGVTRDVSASGVFLWISGMYAYGESISFSMGRKTESGKFMLKCRGDIVRTEWRDDTVGVAVRLIKTAMEPMPSHLSATDALRSAREQPRNINQRWDKALASAIETVDRWSSLLRDKALEAFKQRRGETTLKWDFPSIAVATNPHSRRVTVCSVTVVCLFPKASLALGRSGIRGGIYGDLNLSRAFGEIDARESASEAGVSEESDFVNWKEPDDGRIAGIELATYVANASHGDRQRGTAPLARVVVRATSVRYDGYHQEIEENHYRQKSYSDPTEAFEVFLALVRESSILIRPDMQRYEE